jgi:hypothetical protein
MKKLLWIALVIAFSLCMGANYADEKYPFDYAVREIYSAPSENANLVLRIPIEVRLLDISEDCNWFKVKISYSLGPLNYTYIGWTKIPVGDSLATREKFYSKIDRSADEESVYSAQEK